MADKSEHKFHCENCAQPIKTAQYIKLSKNKRYNDNHVYIIHKSRSACSFLYDEYIAETIKTTEDLALVILKVKE